MFNGMVLYKDIYEQKGPVLYFIYGIAYLLSRTSFIGAFWLEVLFATAYLCALYKICRLYADEIPALIIAILTMAVSFSSFAFYFGGSAEELCFPLVAWPMYFLLKSIKNGDGKMDWRELIISGFLSACVFLIKFTLLSFALAFVLFVIVELIRRKNYSFILKAALFYIAGAAIAFIPWLIYFAANGALNDFFTVYIYNNIFIYGSSGSDMGFIGNIKHRINSYFIDFSRVYSANPFALTIAIIGLLWIIIGNNFKSFSLDKVYLPINFVAVFLFAFIGGYGYYYGLPLTLFTCFGLIGIYSLAKTAVLYIVKRRKAEAAEKTDKGEEVEGGEAEESPSPVKEGEGKECSPALAVKEFFLSVKTRAAAIACAAAAAVSVGVCFLFSQNVSYIGYDKNQLFMFEFASIINEKGGGTILNYGTLDLGVYTLTDTLPICKYFCGLNIQLPELKQTQDEFVREGRADFVVCEASYPENIDDHYTLIATGQKKFDDSENTIYLFQKTH